MKNIFVIALALYLTICTLCGCATVDYPSRPYMIVFNFVDRPWWESWKDKESEIEVKLDINSQFTDDAYLVVYPLGKRYCNTTKFSYFESFMDSLKIDGFHIRAYSTRYGGDPEAHPVYFKKIFVNKGKNQENFKIVFPRDLVSIPAAIGFSIGIGLFNDEMKKRFEENFPGNYELTELDKNIQNAYFETFPDSSKTSFVFSYPTLLNEISFFPEDSIGYKGKQYFFSHQLKLNQYAGAPDLLNCY